MTKGIWRGSEVAVKTFYADLALSSTFIAEVECMSRLAHPSIVQLYGYVIKPGKLAIVSELVSCGSLYKLLHGTEARDLMRRKAIDSQRWLSMVLDIARGMDYLHSRVPAIVHRDLKSLNLLISRNCQVKVSHDRLIFPLLHWIYDRFQHRCVILA